MKHIAFFLSAQEIDAKYSKPALELIRLSVKSGYGFLYGGSQRGLMKQAAREVKKLNGHITAVTWTDFEKYVNRDAHKIHVAKNIPERIQMLLDKSDAIIALPGGSGTLDEITSIIEEKKLDLHQKPVILLNSYGFWDGLITQYQRMFNEGFLPKKPEDLFYVSDKPEKIIKYLKEKINISSQGLLQELS